MPRLGSIFRGVEAGLVIIQGRNEFFRAPWRYSALVPQCTAFAPFSKVHPSGPVERRSFAPGGAFLRGAANAHDNRLDTRAQVETLRH